MLCEALLEIEGFIKSIFPLLAKNKISNDPDDIYKAKAEFWHEGVRYDYFTRGQAEDFIEKLDVYDDFGNRIRHITYKANNLFDDTLHYHILRHEEYDRNGTPCGFWCEFDPFKRKHILADYRKGTINRVIYTYEYKKIKNILTYERGFPITSFNYKDGFLREERYFAEGKIIKRNVFSRQGSITQIVFYDDNNQEKSIQCFDDQGLAIIKKKEEE